MKSSRKNPGKKIKNQKREQVWHPSPRKEIEAIRSTTQLTNIRSVNENKISTKKEFLDTPSSTAREGTEEGTTEAGRKGKSSGGGQTCTKK